MCFLQRKQLAALMVYVAPPPPSPPSPPAPRQFAPLLHAPTHIMCYLLSDVNYIL